MSWLNSLFEKWTLKRERRKVAQQAAPLVACYWSGAPVVYPVENMSPEGIFIRTPDRWRAGTILHLVLQEAAMPERGGRGSSKSISVFAIVVREEIEGMAMNFIFGSRRERRRFENYLSAALSRHTRNANGSAPLIAGESGNGLVEFALILPMLFLLIVNAINFGAFFFAWITVANAARSAGEYAIMAGATVTSPKPATSTQIYNLVVSDISSLLNSSSLAVRACTNNGGTIACTTTGTGAFTNPAADTRAESSAYVMAWVDVSYTYQPMIPLFDFSRLGVHATLPPTVIHRQTVMRMLQ